MGEGTLYLHGLNEIWMFFQIQCVVEITRNFEGGGGEIIECCPISCVWGVVDMSKIDYYLPYDCLWNVLMRLNALW